MKYTTKSRSITARITPRKMPMIIFAKVKTLGCIVSWFTQGMYSELLTRFDVLWGMGFNRYFLHRGGMTNKVSHELAQARKSQRSLHKGSTLLLFVFASP